MTLKFIIIITKYKLLFRRLDHYYHYNSQVYKANTLWCPSTLTCPKYCNGHSAELAFWIYPFFDFKRTTILYHQQNDRYETRENCWYLSYANCCTFHLNELWMYNGPGVSIPGSFRSGLPIFAFFQIKQWYQKDWTHPWSPGVQFSLTVIMLYMLTCEHIFMNKIPFSQNILI